ncbi:acyl-CoA dehydrogenase family protein [Frondihabitans sp. PAMC 28766]|uniref:acyl-CoA dehydrogenase family protein n=1 Tax=Frondihabitans sp. PAMC 28766 TaxID=1795630 RepID=UPI0009EC0C05|nr:acyl-CoA dehydrogenase family protein [Frondihabitans sp. PAMC 28766]
MRWALDSEQKMFADALAGWLDDAAPPEAVRTWLDSADPSSFEAQLAEDGWLAIGLDEDAGGQGGGLLELALVAERLARHAAPSSAWLATVLALPALAGSSAADSVLDESAFAALAVESDRFVDAPARFARSEPGLRGRVEIALGADRARWLVVPVSGDEGAELWLVDAASPGVIVTPTALLDRSRSAAAVELLGAEGERLDVDADAVLRAAALRAAVLVAADSLGAATRMRELAVDYSKQRTQYGQLIGAFQAMKHAAATMLVDEEASRSIVFYSAATVEAGDEESPLHAAVAKAQVTAAGVRTADSSLAMHGAIGYTWEHDLQLLYKRAMLDAPLFGNPALWNERLAGSLDLEPIPVAGVDLNGQSIDIVEPKSIAAKH